MLRKIGQLLLRQKKCRTFLQTQGREASCKPFFYQGILEPKQDPDIPWKCLTSKNLFKTFLLGCSLLSRCEHFLVIFHMH